MTTQLSQEEVKALIRKHIDGLERPATFMMSGAKVQLREKLQRILELVEMLPDTDPPPARNEF